MQREKLRERAGRRTWMFEKRLEERRRSDIGRECRLEMSRRFREGKMISGWEEERKRFFEEKDMKIEKVERKG